MKKRCLFLGCAFLLGLTAPNQPALAQDRYEQERTEVENLLREYYEACSEGDWERAGTLIAMENPYAEKTLGKWAKECGLERYDIIRTDAYHLETGDCWLVWVEYDMAVEDMEAAIPGATTYVLCKGKTDGRIAPARNPRLWRMRSRRSPGRMSTWAGWWTWRVGILKFLKTILNWLNGPMLWRIC